MKKQAIPIEITFRIFVAIAFAGTISFHLLGLGLHTMIGRQKSVLVSRIESVSEIRASIFGLESNLSVLRERTGRELASGSGSVGKSHVSKDIRKMRSSLKVISLLLRDVTIGDPALGRSLETRWSGVMQGFRGCSRKRGPDSSRCFGKAVSRLSRFSAMLSVSGDRMSRILRHVEERQRKLEHWDTLLYWISTFLGLLFMAASWRNVLREVGNPIADVTHYVESYEERSSLGKTSFPHLFSIRELRVLKESMRNLHNDYLTAVLARHAIMDVLGREIALARRTGGPLTVALFDVDFFKKVNDQYGHLAGDQALKHVASRLRLACRSTDWVGRWGGEEFLLVCPGLSKEDALERLDHFRENVREPFFRSPSVVLTISVSVGAAFYGDGQTSGDLLDAADRALYRAKESGRNRVVIDDANAPI